MQIHSNDLTFIQMHEIKAEEWVRFHLENRFYVEHFTLTKLDDYFDLNIQQKFMVQSIVDFERNDGYAFGVLNRKNKLIAKVKSKRDTDPNLNYADIRLLMDHKHRNPETAIGIMQGMIRFLFEDRKVHRIYVTVLEDDDFLLDVVKRLSMHYEGRLDKIYRINGIWRDHLEFSLINPKD